MKTLIWKVRYMFEIRKLLCLSFWFAWEMAGSAVESLGKDIDLWSPKDAAEEERDAWLSSI